MELKDYLINQTFKIVADKVYTSIGARYKRIADNPRELEEKIKVLKIKQDLIGDIPLEECNSRQVFEAFILAYMNAEDDLKKNSAYEHWKPKTKSLREIAADIEQLDSYSGRKSIEPGLKLSLKIKELFLSGQISQELLKYSEEQKTGQKRFDF